MQLVGVCGKSKFKSKMFKFAFKFSTSPILSPINHTKMKDRRNKGGKLTTLHHFLSVLLLLATVSNHLCKHVKTSREHQPRSEEWRTYVRPAEPPVDMDSSDRSRISFRSADSLHDLEENHLIYTLFIKIQMFPAKNICTSFG